MSMDLILMVAALFRMVEGRPFTDATEQEKANYAAICRECVERVKAEKARQPEGQKEVA